MKIGGFNLTQKVLVVAEIGNNHEGDFATAQKLVGEAAACGVGAVKFQVFRARYFVSAGDRARYDRLSSFELSYEQFEELHRLAKSLGLLFIATPLDLESAAFLEGIVDAYKIASGDNNFYPLMDRVCRTGKPLILSTGLSDLNHIRRAKAFIEAQWRKRGVEQHLAVLHCVSSYPVPPEQANLGAIPMLIRELECTVGYSDHTLGIQACVIGAALGARIIEKHFTLDKQYSDFRDHQLSADPVEMGDLVARVAETEGLLGTGEKIVQAAEAESARLARRSIVAGADLPAGHRVRFEDLTWIRPATGLPPGEEARVVGKRLRRAVAFGEPILPADVE
ncbi:MAG: N-acetylneuraminate synthase family protein [Candidatus Methylomirabilales bacterium]